MKNKKYEFVQKIKSHYVKDNCVQIMAHHYIDGGMTILNADGMIYHYKPYSSLFINKYMSDNRRFQFPYSKIPHHKAMVRFKIMECFNQLLEFNRTYIEIHDGIIREIYAIKDGEEALLVTKFILPNEEETKFMTRDEVLELLKKANGGMFSFDGGYYQDYNMPSEEKILEWYKEKIIEKREQELEYYDGGTGDKELTEYFYKSLDKLTIDDVPSNITVIDDVILISTEENEIKSVKAIDIKFMSTNNYVVQSYDFPITIYSLEQLKQMPVINSPEPKISRLLNKTIDKEEIENAKRLILKK